MYTGPQITGLGFSHCIVVMYYNKFLSQIQVIVRHGARTPIWVLPNFPEARYDKKLFRGTLSHTDFDYDVYHMSGAKAEGLSQSIVNKR